MLSIFKKCLFLYPTGACPGCNSKYINRVNRRLIDRLIAPFAQIKRYRCTDCGWEGSMIVKKSRL